MSRPLQSCECFRKLCCGSGAVSVHRSPGLPHPCVVRLKLFTLDERLVLGPLGALANGDRAAVIAQLAKLFGNPGPEVG